VDDDDEEGRDVFYIEILPLYVLGGSWKCHENFSKDSSFPAKI
jgi:hypothetical protein